MVPDHHWRTLTLSEPTYYTQEVSEAFSLPFLTQTTPLDKQGTHIHTFFF